MDMRALTRLLKVSEALREGIERDMLIGANNSGVALFPDTLGRR